MSDEIEGDVVYHPDDSGEYADEPEDKAPVKEQYLMPMPREGADLYKRGFDRDAEAARLKAIGYTLPEICERLRLGPDTSRAAAAIRRALARSVRFAYDEMRIMEMQSLEELEATTWRTLRNRHVLVSNGRVVHDETGEPLEDDRFVLEMVDRILKIKERRARMLGLDAPTRAEVITIDSIDAEIARLEAQVHASKVRPAINE